MAPITRLPIVHARKQVGATTQIVRELLQHTPERGDTIDGVQTTLIRHPVTLCRDNAIPATRFQKSEHSFGVYGTSDGFL